MEVGIKEKVDPRSGCRLMNIQPHGRLGNTNNNPTMGWKFTYSSVVAQMRMGIHGWMAVTTGCD
jgi:hypothetical protein